MKALKNVLLCAALPLMAASCQKPQEKEIPVSSVTLDRTSLTLAIGDAQMLAATVLPADATDPALKWSSSAPGVASVTDGLVIGLSEGSTVITVSASSKLAYCKVTVKREVTPVESVTLDKVSLALVEGTTGTLTATVLPENATEKEVTWTSSDESVATVEDGVVTAIAEGAAAIVASAGGKSAACAVIVCKKIIPVESVSLDATSLELFEGDMATLTATVLPEDATDKTVTWTSSNTMVAMVVGGVLTAISEGSATITATAGEKSASCSVVVSKKFIPVTSVNLDKASLALVEGENATLTATVLPTNASDKTVTWISSNPAVATVAGGVVTAVAEGNATITAMAGEKSATCAVVVSKKVIPVETVTLDKISMALEEGATATLTATVLPADATDKTVTWSSNNPAVATVVDGVVTAVAEGKATIMATAGEKTATCAIIVSKKIIPVTSVTLNTTFLELVEGDMATLTANVLPEDATDRTVTWSSSNSSVASVAEGVVTALTVGSATITAAAGDCTATCTVIVNKKIIDVTSVTLDKISIALEEGATETLTATVLPEDATDKTVTWSSSDPAVATVAEGVVTAIAEGNATITATAGSFSATCEVIVSKKVIPVESVTLDTTFLELVEGDSATLTATVLPEDATDKTVTWSSSDPAVATVAEGIVTAVAEGTATITAAAGEFTATCEVTVDKKFVPVESISLNKTAISLVEGSSETLTATVYPENATDKTVTWSSSNPSVATVTDGVVTAVALGTATITATAGDVSATCEVTVVDSKISVTGVTLSQTSVDLEKGQSVTLTATVLPADATDKSVTWTSSAPSVASVTADGFVQALTSGTAVITVRTNDGGFEATCTVTVKNAPGSGASLEDMNVEQDLFDSESF